jgi:hypothetical protein
VPVHALERICRTAGLWTRDLPAAAATALALLRSTYKNPNLDTYLLAGVDRLREMYAGPNGDADLRCMLNYISDVSDRIIELGPVMDRLGPEAKEAYMTMREQLEARGEAKGEAKILLRLLQQKFGTLSDAILDTVRKANTEQLEAWSDHILAAKTLNEVFTG